MEALKPLIARAQTGDLSGFGEIIRRFQNMAVGYAYSILGDFHLAEDAAQEAFIEAYQCLLYQIQFKMTFFKIPLNPPLRKGEVCSPP